MRFLDEIIAYVAGQSAGLDRLSRMIWENPELGYQEHFACTAQFELLQNWGFEVTKNYCGVETAYRVEHGSDGPVFVIAAEYDALPGVGHGCGHNLICSAALGAFYALCKTMQNHNIAGRAVLLGTPAEEGGGGKLPLLRSGCLDGAAAVMMVHPQWQSTTDAGSLGLTDYNVTFHGVSAHAGGSPECGINALDAVQLVFAGVNAWRQQLPESSRVHGIVTDGGLRPNIIPEKAGCNFFLRAENGLWQQRMEDRFQDIVKGASLMTGADFDIARGEDSSYKARCPARLLNNIYKLAMEAQGVEVAVPSCAGRGSSDFGDFSQIVPGIHPYFGISQNGKIPGHSNEFREAAATAYAHEQMHKAAAAMAVVGVNVLTDGELRKDLMVDFQKQMAEQAGKGEK